MFIARIFVALALVSVAGMASAQSFHSSLPGKETTTRPWTAPVGHRQPHAADIPATALATPDVLDQEDALIDRKISGICRGC